jgi:hypothetical protein
LIPGLITAQGEVSDQPVMVEHVYQFYQGLMGSVGETGVFSLSPRLWDEHQRISDEENVLLEPTFTIEDLDEVLHSMKVDSAPGPDGLSVLFFRRFWGTLKGPILRLRNDFALGRVDIARQNFGIISLGPKVKGADNIKQFQPTALINIIFKFVAKAYAI